MNQTLSFRYTLIALVLGASAYLSYRGLWGGDLQLGTDLKGGSELVFKFDFKQTGEGSHSELLSQAIGIIRQRIDGFGLKELVITPIGDDRFSVQVSAEKKSEVEAIKGLITVLGLLEFRITVEPTQTNYTRYWKQFQDKVKAGVDIEEARLIRPADVVPGDSFPLGLKWYRLSADGERDYQPSRLPRDEAGRTEPWVLCEIDAHDITGSALTAVNHRLDTERRGGGGWVVTFGVKREWQSSLQSLTSLEKGTRYMAIILNEQVDSAPVLNSSLSDSGEISGSFTRDEARQLAAVLQAGALREKPQLISENTVAAELAGSARTTGVLSVFLGLALVLVFMVWLYYGSGLIANLALVLNLVLLVGVLTWFGAVMTLPGIAGVVLTVGMAVDANILVLERVKEEKSRGRTVAQAIESGYDRALVTIIDSNLTTLITAYFLFQIGSGPVKGFGVTLAIGIIASMFTALYVTRTLYMHGLRRGWVTQAKMRGEFSPPAYRWMQIKRPAVLGSVIAMAAGIVVFEIVPDPQKYDLEFTQGSRLVMRCHRDLKLEDVRRRLDALGEKNATWKGVTSRVSAEGIGTQIRSGEGSSFELRSQGIATEDEIDAFVVALREAFAADLLPGPFRATLRRVEGGGSAGEIYFRKAGIPAIVLEDAFAQAESRGVTLLRDTKVELLPAVPGAGSAFRLSFEAAAVDEDEIAVTVRRALEAFDRAGAQKRLEEVAASVDSTPAVKQRAAEQLELLGKATDLADGAALVQCDPLPFADRIDPFTAREHRDDAVRAIAFSIAGIILYVAFRFRSWAYGFAAVIALIHDVIVCLGLVTLANWAGLVDARLNLVTVAAFLTLIGYSINDTIVIFDRIRENRTSHLTRVADVIDRSVNQTLARTIRTSVATLLAVVVMFVMNYGAGSSLEGFAFVLTLGIVIGSYSTIFVASPILVFLPWLWKQCGSNTRTFLMRCLPWCIGCAALLLLVDGLRGNLTGDWSRTGFFDIVMAAPAGVLAYFLAQLVRFVNGDRDGSLTAST